MFQKLSFYKRTFSKRNYLPFFICIGLVLTSSMGYSQLATEAFESGIPGTWAVTSNVIVTNNWVATPTGGYLASGGATVNPSLNNTVGVTAKYFMISPQFTTPSNGEIRFYTKQGSFANKGATYELRISTANQPDITSFNVVLGSWTEAELNVAATTYEEKVVSIATINSGIPVYIAFVEVTNQTGTTNTSGDSWFIDNVRVIGGCSPATLVTPVPGATSAVINWSHPFATQFGVDVVPLGAGHGAVGTIVNGTSYTTPVLASNTSYDFYIQTRCDATTLSTWAGPFTFHTNPVGFTCDTAIIIPSDLSTAPYVLGANLNSFNNQTNYTSYSSAGLSCQPANTPSTWNWFSGDHAFLSYTPTTSGLINISQVINPSTGGGCFGNTSSSVFIFDSCTGVGTNASCLGAITTGTPSSVISAHIDNFYVQANHTYIFLISSPYLSNGPPGAGICFEFTISAPTCPKPSDLTYDNLLQNSASFSWANPQNIVSSWQYVAIPASLGAPTGSETLTTTSTNTNNPLSGLIAGTAYNFYVRSVCNGTPGPWSAPLPFTTLCTVLQPPYYTGFTNTAETACWSQININNDAYFFTFGNSANSEPVAKIRPAFSNDMLVSPQFHFDGVTQKRLRFKYNIYGNWGLAVNPTPGPGAFEVRLSTTGVGPNNFTTIVAPLQDYITGYNFIEKIIPLPAGLTGNINIAWVLPAGATQTGIGTYFDDVYVEDLPACSTPLYPAVTASSITSTSAELTWTNGYNTSQWEIIAQPLGSGIPTVSGLLVGTNPYTMTGLLPSTRYEFYIRSYCDAIHQSEWVGPITFNTVCIAQFAPYYESFNDDDVATKKFCWTVNNPGADVTKWDITGTEASIQGRSTFTTPFTSFDDWLISVPITAVGQKRLRFDYRAATQWNYPTSRGNLEVLLSATPDFSTYTVLMPSHDFTNSNYLEDSVLFNATGTFYIAFRIPPTMTNPSNSGIIMLDNVRIEDAPLCPAPANLAVSAITTNSAHFSWTAGNLETQWRVVFQTAGSGVPTTTGTLVNTTPVFNVSGLATDTSYEFYVKAICNATDASVWVGPFLFKTICNPLPTPFFETFDSNSTTESCWTTVNENTDGHFWNLNQTVNPIAGNQMAAMFTGSNGANNDWLITPTLLAQPNQRLRFYYKVMDDSFEEDLKIKLSVNGVATSQFSTLLYETSFSTTTAATGTITGTNTLTVTSSLGIKLGDTFYITGWPFPYGTTVTNISGNVITMSANATLTQAGIQDVVFTHATIKNMEYKEMVINLTNITAPTPINIGFQIPFFPPNPWAYRGQYLFIDNVIVEDIPVCPTITNVTATDIIDTTAKIDWDVIGNETAWEISVQPFGTAAPIGNTLPQYLTTTTTHPKIITGLTPATQYQYYVRAICSATSPSAWMGPYEFTTRCDLTNVCQYTMSVTNGTSGHVTRSVDVIQNGIVVQSLNFPSSGSGIVDFQVYLCSGVEYKLYWNGMGSGIQYSQAQIVIKNEANAVVWTSPLGLGTVNSDIYTGFASCTAITCPQPKNLTTNNQGVLSWTAGGSETQWEVFVQPYGNGTLPQSGHLVNAINYTPTATDFVNSTSGTYEYFVRAICSATNTSYWSGPKVFIRNDEPTTAIHLPTNASLDCVNSGKDASFIGATASTTPTTCAGINGGDIWFDFVATSKIHNIELSDFSPGSYYASSYAGIWPKIIMSLYEVQSGGVLVEKGCSENNSLVTMYSTELVVGNTYKIRLKLNDTTPNDKKFHICITTPNDLCNLDSFNYDFEKLVMQSVTGIPTILNARVIPGWRVNTDAGQMYYQEGSNSPGVIPYSGGQCIQLVQDNASAWNPSDPNIKGLYKDFDTSEILQMDYSFASASRSNGTTLQLYAGPPSGPFTLVTEHLANSLVWQIISGKYMIPSGQNTTRFIFRVKNNEIGHVLDAANFKPNNAIITANTTLNCTNNSILVEAQGIGQWVADTSNPAITVIATPNNKNTTISGFTSSGIYIYHWKTRYCDKTITITFQGISETPVVTSPVHYCLNAIAQPLTATVGAGYSLKWYTVPTLGVGSTNAPTPSTAVVGNSQVFYVCATDTNGCEGPRVAITVIVDDLPTITGSGTTCVGLAIQLVGSGTAASTNAWASSDTAVATISATGLVTGIAFGTTTITYTNNNGCTKTTTVTVVSQITPTFAPIIACQNDIIAFPSHSIENITGTWTPSVINSNTIGTTLYAFSPNTSLPGQSCAIAGTLSVTINALPTVSGTLTVCSGLTTQLVGSGTAATTNAWSSSNPAIATVSATGLVTGLTAGTTTITYTNSNNCSFSSVLTVHALPIITGSGTTCVGMTNQLSGSGTAATTNAWTSSNTGVATISTTGLITGVTAGTATITYTNSNGCSVTTLLTVIPLPIITGTLAVCAGSSTQLTGNGTAITTNAWSSSNTGVATVSSSGLVTGISSGNATITYTNENSCVATAIVTVDALPTITGSLTTCVGTTSQLTGSGTAAANAWTSSNSVIATVNATGLVTGLTAGTTTITYSNSKGCQTNATAIITPLATPNVTFSYAQSCINAATSPLPIPTSNFVTGGVYSSTTLTVNATTGAIDLATATVGSHQVLYTLASNSANCIAGGTYTATVVLTSGITPITGFTYAPAYCANAPNASPTKDFEFYTGGVFSSTPGLVIDAATGVITIDQSTSGNYTIIYTVQPDLANCNLGGTSSFAITIKNAFSFTIEAVCQNQMLELQVNPTNNSFNTIDANYIWTNASGTVVGTNADHFNVDNYLTQNPTLQLPLPFTVSVNLNGCSIPSTFTVANNPCELIPRGISPNNDQLNDTFDLTGFGVTSILIFNRYGTKVYSFSGVYTNQWNGLSNSGDELPDGTYFYNIQKDNGVIVTGWVYINR